MENGVGDPRRRAGRRGFSVIEVLIVLVVLAISAVLVVPLFRDEEVMGLRGAARLLLADLEYARIRSMAHSDDPSVVRVDSASNRYYIAAASDADTPIANAVGGQSYDTTLGVGRAQMARRVSIQSYDFGGDDQLGFGMYGELDQIGDATIVLAADGHTVTIQIDAATGEVTAGDVQ